MGELPNSDLFKSQSLMGLFKALYISDKKTSGVANSKAAKDNWDQPRQCDQILEWKVAQTLQKLSLDSHKTFT